MFMALVCTLHWLWVALISEINIGRLVGGAAKWPKTGVVYP